MTEISRVSCRLEDQEEGPNPSDSQAFTPSDPFREGPSDTLSQPTFFLADGTPQISAADIFAQAQLKETQRRSSACERLSWAFRIFGHQAVDPHFIKLPASLAGGPFETLQLILKRAQGEQQAQAPGVASERAEKIIHYMVTTLQFGRSSSWSEQQLEENWEYALEHLSKWNLDGPLPPEVAVVDELPDEATALVPAELPPRIALGLPDLEGKQSLERLLAVVELTRRVMRAPAISSGEQDIPLSAELRNHPVFREMSVLVAPPKPVATPPEGANLPDLSQVSSSRALILRTTGGTEQVEHDPVAAKRREAAQTLMLAFAMLLAALGWGTISAWYERNQAAEKAHERKRGDLSNSEAPAGLYRTEKDAMEKDPGSVR